MNDREMLELAAKAAGMTIDTHYVDGGACAWAGEKHNSDWIPHWNPLTDDGDALRLAVRLNIPVFPYDDETSTATVGVVAKNWGSKEANTRRAIFRAAVEIGRHMK